MIPRQTDQFVRQDFVVMLLVNSLPVGYEGGKKTRCTDRFVRYPYPKMLNSNYKVNFASGKLELAGVKSHKQAFNLEKETKIINPHKMDTKTTTNTFNWQLSQRF